jgi:hypothetical protein
MCYYDSYGNRIIGNTLLDNGDYGNPTNSDLANYAMNLQPRSGYKEPDNCFVGNRDRAGLTSDPPAIQRVWGTCEVHRPSPEALLAAEAECASQLLGPCPSLPGTHYPRARAHFALRMPRPQPTMPRPCAGVPANPWCPAPAGSSGGGWRPLGLPVGFAAPLAAGLVFLLAGPGVLRRRRRATARPA